MIREAAAADERRRRPPGLRLLPRSPVVNADNAESPDTVPAAGAAP
jgi:hypothetical protein